MPAVLYVLSLKLEMPRFRTIAELEKYHIKRILDEVKWNKLEASHIL